MKTVAVAALLVLGCSASRAATRADDAGDDASAPPSPSSSPVVTVAGEVHLHEFPSGGHAWADFTSTPRDVSELRGDSLFELDSEPTKIEGPCTLFTIPTCTPACASGTFCYADGDCAPIPQTTYVDAGAVVVIGSSTVPEIRLFTNGGTTYVADPAPGTTKLYAGGELLDVGGCDGDYEFHGQLPAPKPVTVTLPDLTQPLAIPLDGPLDLAWQSEDTDQIEVYLTASTSGGSGGVVRCVTTDGGALRVPVDLVAALPRPPRSTRLEIVRVEQRVFAMKRAGYGVLVHAAQSTWKNGQD
jgi:hypothetical protein